MALRDNKFIDKLNNFFVKNWWFNGISNMVIIVLLIVFINKIEDFKVDTTKRINIATQHIVYGTPDGRVGLLDRQLIETDNKVFQNAVALVAKNMHASEEILTQGFDSAISSKITSPASLVKVSENFALLHKEYFDSKLITFPFLRHYYNLLKSGELAKKSSIVSTSYDYTSNGSNGFTMKITFKTSKDFINKIDNSPIELIVNDIILLNGYVDPTKHSSPLNPFGIRFTTVRLNLYTYGDYIKETSR
jgi:hypothetical protein